MAPKVRRVVAGHDGKGNPIIQFDDYAPPLGRGSLIWTTNAVPADNMEPYNGSPPPGMTSTEPEGAHFFMWTFAPGHVSPMHRTETIDYVYVISGRVELTFEDGNRVALAAGDTIVQRGAVHGWENPWDEPCTMIATAVRAMPLDLPDN